MKKKNIVFLSFFYIIRVIASESPKIMPSKSPSAIPQPQPLLRLTLPHTHSSSQLSTDSLSHSPLSQSERKEADVGIDADPVLYDTVTSEPENPPIAQPPEHISSERERTCKKLCYCAAGIGVLSLALTAVALSTSHPSEPPANNSTANATSHFAPIHNTISHHEMKPAGLPIHYVIPKNPIKHRKKTRKKNDIHQPRGRK